MRISSKLQLTSLFYLFLTIALSISLLIINGRMDAMNDSHLLTHNIIYETSELHLLINNTILYEGRVLTIDDIDDYRLRTLYASPVFSDQQQIAVLDEMERTLDQMIERIKELDMVSDTEARRLMGHILLDAQSMTIDAIRLEEYSNLEVFRAQRQSTFVLFLYIACFTMLLVVSTIIHARHIVQPISRLTSFVKRINDKDTLGEQYEDFSDDELGELAASFNGLSAKLASSNTQLEKQTDEMKQTVKQVEHQNTLLEDSKKAMLNVLEDLSREKEAIEKSSAKDEAVLNSIGDGLVLTDQEGTIMMVNKGFEEILGWNKEEVLGEPMTKIMPVIDRTGSVVPWEKRPQPIALFTGKHFTNVSDYSYVRKDKTSFPVSITVTPVVMNNTVIGAIEVFRDITREKEIDRAKSEFVSLASHQLRTPLSTIGWYTEMLLAGDTGKLKKAQQEYMQEVYDSNRRMVELVNALLNVSRIEMGTFVVEPEPTDLVKICSDVIKELKPLITKKKMKVTTEYDSELEKINADTKLTRIIFQNLLSNAVKYTPEKGSVSVSIKKQGATVVITVADTGYGIPKAQQKNIFTKLFRADNVRENVTDGTGLGLYIAKSILDASGGTIAFKSKENKGTTFIVTLPIRGMKPKEGTKKLEEKNT
ncbi:MAG: ATP-binding protein [Candidatus Kerfeldbacteria bacterium]